jgi:transaldolase
MRSCLPEIAAFGQSIWLDFISRDLIRTGRLAELVDEGLGGVTSNPTIFHKSICGGQDYDDAIRSLAAAGRGTREIYESLAIADVREAADVLRPVYDRLAGADGFVSLEVDPFLASDTRGTIAEARRLFAAVNRPNLMIKVPATTEGLPAIRTLISEGTHVNVTLIFSLDRYREVIRAYQDGLCDRIAAGKDPGSVASVASFFVSRVDSLIDERLSELSLPPQELAALRGRAAVANAKLAYSIFQEAFGPAAFSKLRSAGARVQRPLWASTSTKNPAYPSTKYIDPLIGPDTVNTVPPQTLAAIRELAHPARTIDADVPDARVVLERLARVGIDMQRVTDKLLVDGVKLFADSFRALLDDLEHKRAELARQPGSREASCPAST